MPFNNAFRAGAGGYFDPRNTYGAQQYGFTPQRPFTSSPVGQRIIDADREAAYTRFLRERGIGQFGSRANFARQQYPQVEEGFRAAQLTNPFLPFYGAPGSYLGGIDLDAIYRALVPSQRGESNFPSRARTIPRA